VLGVQLSHPSSQALWVAGICRDRVNLGSGVSQVGSELSESVRAASDQGDSIPAAGEATGDGQPKTRTSTDQEKVAVVDRGGATY
jgi:hypothetical protein